LDQVNEDVFFKWIILLRKTLKLISFDIFGDISDSNGNEKRENLNTESKFENLIHSFNEVLSEPEKEILNLPEIQIGSEIEFFDL